MGQFYTDPSGQASFWVPDGWTPSQMWKYLQDTNPQAKQMAAQVHLQPAPYTPQMAQSAQSYTSSGQSSAYTGASFDHTINDPVTGLSVAVHPGESEQAAIQRYYKEVLGSSPTPESVAASQNAAGAGPSTGQLAARTQIQSQIAQPQAQTQAQSQPQPQITTTGQPDWTKASNNPTVTPVQQPTATTKASLNTPGAAFQDTAGGDSGTSTTPTGNDGTNPTGASSGTPANVSKNVTLQAQDGSGRTITLPSWTADGQNTDALLKNLDYYTRNGWAPVNAQGQPMKIVDYKGGQVFIDPANPRAPQTLNSLAGGYGALSQAQMTEMASPDFAAAMARATQPAPTTSTPAPAPSQYGGVGTNPDELARSVSQITQEVFNRIPGAEQIFGNAQQFSNQLITMLNSDRNLRDQLLPQLMNPSEFENSLRQTLSNTLQQRDSAVNGVMGDTSVRDALPGLQAKQDQQVSQFSQPALAEINRSMAERDTGLSDSAKAALYGTAKDNAVNNYDSAAVELKRQLAGRGMLGGDSPTSGGDLIRSFAPLLSQRENAVSAGERSTVMADEQAKVDAKNRALQAAGLSGSLAGTLGSIYDPSKITNILNQDLATRTSGAATLGNVYNPAPFISGINDAASNRTNMFNSVNTAYNGSNLISGANTATSNANNAMQTIAQLLNIGAQGNNTMAGVIANQQTTDWMKILLSSVFGGLSNAKDASGKTIWDTIIGGIGSVFNPAVNRTGDQGADALTTSQPTGVLNPSFSTNTNLFNSPTSGSTALTPQKFAVN